MRKENFENLMIDLYSAYNPDFIKYVPQLADKYNRLEFDAIQNILIKYNHESYSHYDPEKAKDEYIHYLIKNYNEGNRILQGFILSNIKEAKKEELNNQESEKQKEENLKKEEELKILKESLKKVEGEIEMTKQDLEEKLSKFTNSEPSIQKVSPYDNIEIIIKTNYTDSVLVLPNKDVLAGLGKGTRLIVKDNNDKIIGLVVEEILYDNISHPLGVPTIEIIINKG